jgi:hypothetical protein
MNNHHFGPNSRHLAIRVWLSIGWEARERGYIWRQLCAFDYFALYDISQSYFRVYKAGIGAALNQI